MGHFEKQMWRTRLAIITLLVAVMTTTTTATAASRSFVVLGDWGIHYDVQQRVARRIAALPTRPTAVISTGDNFYYSGVTSVNDIKFKQVFENVFQSLGVPWLLSTGNHDCRGNVTAQIQYTKRNPLWIMPNRWYRRTYTLDGGAAVSFFMLDACNLVCNPPNYPALPREGDCHDSGTKTMAEAQLNWLSLELKELRGSARAVSPYMDGDDSDDSTNKHWVFVVTHWPLYTAGHHGDTATLQTLLLPILHKYRVDAVLSGHDHTLQHLHDGRIHYIVSGGGGYDVDTELVAHEYLRKGVLSHGFFTLSLNATDAIFDMVSLSPFDAPYSFNL